VSFKGNLPEIRAFFRSIHDPREPGIRRHDASRPPQAGSNGIGEA